MNSKTSTNSKLETLLEIEREGVEHLMHRGINVWPIIRSELQFNVKRDESEQGNERVETNYTLFQKLKGRLKAYLKFRNLKKNILKKKWHQSDILLFSADDTYYADKIEGKRYNRHLDPFYEKLLELKKSVSKLHMTALKEISNKKNEAQFLILDAEISEWIWLDTEFSDTNLNEAITTICSRLDVSADSVRRRTGSIIALSKIVELILNKIQPKVIGIVCFYCNESFAIINAAKRLKIKTIEIQHGKQGEKHFCYSHNLTAKSQMSLMPDYFWNWGINSARNINQHIANEGEQIKCIVGGNLWLALWKNKNNQEKEEKENNLFFENLNRFEKRILIGTQPIDIGLFPDFVFDLIKERKDIFWGVRLHPMQIERLDEFRSKLESIENVEIVQSTALPLYLLFNAFDIVITRWSSVALEAILFNLTSVIIDEFGVESFHKEIKAGDIKIALNKQQLIEIIDNESASDKPFKKANYIEFNDHKIKEMLNKYFS
ncbi:hypothetical protein N8987_02435 [Crocinitomix sp.]|nr:hypothetical protein [Crocinitomix sp.]